MARVPKNYCDNHKIQKAFKNKLWRAYSLCTENAILTEQTCNNQMF